ncbi:hypothetical protein [Clostridium chrysemydis]|uniref:hypothetical protein n=1 Tax=Clostridium chrysemydis TaxID=2665504 RepID=UPI003F385819
MRKKRGSSLLLVLGITFILITVGGIVTTSVMHTTGQHNNVKVESDLTYAAESGIESAYSRIKSGAITLKNGDPKKEYEINDIFNNENIEVKIEVSRNDNKYLVESEATKGTKKSKVKGTLSVNKNFVAGDNSVFKYVLCTKKADIECGGGLDGVVTLWNVRDVDNSNFIQNAYATPSNVTVNMAKEDFVEPNFTFEKRGTLEINKISDLDSYTDASKKLGVRKITKKGINIYLINLKDDNSYLKIKSSPLMILNTVIITNGKIKVGNDDFGMTSAPGLTLSSSTILAEEIDMRISTFHSVYRLIDNDVSANDILTDNDIVQINNELDGFINNWNSNTGSSDKEDIIIGDVEYIE